MTAHEEEPEITLEEKIKILQEKGLQPKKIVEEILKEDLNADVTILANTLDLDKLVIGRIKGRLSRLKKQRERKRTEKIEHEEGPLYKGELDTTKILEEILGSHPDISPKIVKEVLSWADYGPIHPTQLVYLLQSMKGVSSITANVVAQKYNLALQRAQQEGKQITPPLGGPMPSQPQWGLPAAFSTGFPPSIPSAASAGGMPPPQYGVQLGMPHAAPQYWPQPWQPPQQDVRTVVEREIHALEERLKPKEDEKYVEIEEPWRDDDGQLVIGPNHQPIVRRMRVPAHQATHFIPQEDTELKFLKKLEEYRKLFGKEELTAEKVRDIIRQERPSAVSEVEKPVTREELKAASAEAAEEAAKRVMEAREKEDKEERRHQEVIGAIERSSTAKTVQGYREDGYRILGQGMSEAATIAREKKPVEVVARVLFGEGGLPPKEVTRGAGEGLLARLQQRGWVTER